jgi:DNA-binding IclR family transcriptional regulator
MTIHTIGSIEQYLEELETVRQVGFAVDREESSIGVHCISAPVRSKRGEVIAAISVSGFGMDKQKINEMGLSVKSYAAQLSRRMGSVEDL